MRIILFLSLLNLAFLSNTFFELKEQTNEKIIINFNLKDYEIEKKELGDVISIPGSGTRSLIGDPLLPSISSFIQLHKHKSYNIEYVYSDKPINRFKTKPILEDKPKLLDNLRGEIENIDNCELKSNSTRLVFSDGNYQSQIRVMSSAGYLFFPASGMIVIS